MRPIKLLGSFMLLLFLPLYAEEIQPTTPIAEPPLVQEETPVTVNEVTPTPQAEPTPEATHKMTQASKIETLIQTVQDAPDAEKRVLMNQLKRELKTMNQTSRHQAMMRLKKAFSKHKGQEDGSQQRRQHQRQHAHREGYQQGNHQPKFRHLHLGRQNGSKSHQGEGQQQGQRGQGEQPK